MNAIIYYDYGPNYIDGALINSLEYFLATYEHNKNVVLLLLNSSNENKIAYIKMIYERYDLEGLEGFESNIIPFDRSKLVSSTYDVVAICTSAHTIKYTKGILRANKILVISDLFLDNPDFFLGKDKYNVTYYGEMPFQYKDYQYNLKMLFDRYKPLPFVKEGLYVHSPKNKDRSFLSEIQLPDMPIIFRDTTHVENFFCYYTRFFYYHAHKWFDPTPRLMHESHFYGKSIHYHNKWGLRDGSFYRYCDLLANGLKNRILNKSDEIVRQLI